MEWSGKLHRHHCTPKIPGGVGLRDRTTETTTTEVSVGRQDFGLRCKEGKCFKVQFAKVGGLFGSCRDVESLQNLPVLHKLGNLKHICKSTH